MQMDSYYYGGFFHDDAPFYPHGAPPPSPELPFALIASPEPPPPQEMATATAFGDFYGAAGPEMLLPAAAPHGAGMMGAPPAPAIGLDDQPMRDAGGGGGGGEEEEQKGRRRAGAVESSRGFRHMMRERQRREKLSQSYADLYAMVAARSKGDKNSIVQAAAIYIRELEGARQQLQRKNQELKATILGHDERRQCVKVQFEVDEPSSPADSMIAALRRLKSMDVRARSIRSSLSGRRLHTDMSVETMIAASEVEKAVEEALKQVERNQPEPDSGAHFPGTSGGGGRGWGPQESSHVQNVF
ncbi:hypothetical protein ACP4OV_026608 [Aristida adscensionis]